MKTNTSSLLLASLVLGTLAVSAQAATTPDAVTPGAATPATSSETPVTPTSESSAPATTATSAASSALTLPNGEKGIRLNFRNTRLETVLNYYSSAAGYIIVLDAPVSGSVDVWSQQPVSKEEAVDLLDKVLAKNGFAALRDGRTLTIIRQSDSRYKGPVNKGANPDEIPKTDKIVTQIIPIAHANAPQMIRDLQPLMDMNTGSMTANESANSIVVTDTQANIHRFAEIIKALDGAISGIQTIKVFPLRYADAKSVADEVKELFPSTDSQNGARNPFGGFGGRGGRGGGGGGGFPGFAAAFGGGGGQGDGTTGQSEARQAASRITCVADDRSNSLIVSAPDELMTTIKQLIDEIDVSVDDVTELKVFPLTHADPLEMVDMLKNLFPDDTTANGGGRGQTQFRGGGRFGGNAFGGGFGGFGGGAATASTGTSERMKKKGRVSSVADERTHSLIVSAASEMMPEIEKMIHTLDEDDKGQQRVHVYSLANADADTVSTVLQTMFPSQNTRNQNNQNTSALTRRQQNSANNASANLTGLSTGTGTGAGGGAGGRRVGN